MAALCHSHFTVYIHVLQSSLRSQVRVVQVARPSDDENKFWVSQILGFKVGKRGKILFRVRWWGYSAEEDTFEPFENLDKDPLSYRWANKAEQQKCAKLLAKSHGQ